MAKSRRHSAASTAMSDEQWDEYRALCLDRKATLEQIAEWAEADCGLTLSVSMVHRDSEYFRKAADKVERMQAIGVASREIMAAAQEGGGIAEAQAATIQMLTQLAADHLLGQAEIAVEDLPKYAQFGSMLAKLQSAEIARYREGVLTKAREASAAVEALAGQATGDVKKQLDQLAKDILGVAA